MESSNRLIKILCSTTVVYLIFFLGYIASARGLSSWYPFASRPPWGVVSFLFVPIWLLVYIPVAFAVWRAYERRYFDVLIVCLAQLIAQIGWQYCFFDLRKFPASLTFAGLEVVLGIIIFATLAKKDLKTGILLQSITVWAIYSIALTAAIHKLNP